MNIGTWEPTPAMMMAHPIQKAAGRWKEWLMSRAKRRL
jgi:hypothetical protein